MAKRRLLTASWLSFQGAWQRTRALASRVRAGAPRLLFWALVAPLILLAWWTVVAAWYVLWLALMPFAFIVIVPWRLLRRSSRLAKQLEER
jgi:Flp pilus assembly protein TadB